MRSMRAIRFISQDSCFYCTSRNEAQGNSLLFSRCRPDRSGWWGLLRLVRDSDDGSPIIRVGSKDFSVALSLKASDKGFHEVHGGGLKRNQFVQNGEKRFGCHGQFPPAVRTAQFGSNILPFSQLVTI